MPLNELTAQISEAASAFPNIEWKFCDTEFVGEGKFELQHAGATFDEYELLLRIPITFPNHEPTLFETGGRIAHSPDFHVNSDGSACYEVFEFWLASVGNPSVLNFIRGPVHNYFLSQTSYQLSGEWPFGERAHGVMGIIEAVAEAIDVNATVEAVAPILKVLSAWPAKGHHICPCGSGFRFRDCHRDAVACLHKKISPALADRMIIRIRDAIEANSHTPTVDCAES